MSSAVVGAKAVYNSNGRPAVEIAKYFRHAEVSAWQYERQYHGRSGQQCVLD